MTSFCVCLPHRRTSTGTFPQLQPTPVDGRHVKPVGFLFWLEQLADIEGRKEADRSAFQRQELSDFSLLSKA